MYEYIAGEATLSPLYFSLLKDEYSCILGIIILLCNNPVTPLIRAPDKWGYCVLFKDNFSYFSMKTYVVTPH